MIGIIFLHLAVESRSPHIRRQVIGTLEASTFKLPVLVNRAVTAALTVYLSHPMVSSSKVLNGNQEEAESSVYKEGRLPLFVLASVAFDPECTSIVREDSLVNLVVIAHHPLLCESWY